MKKLSIFGIILLCVCCNPSDIDPENSSEINTGNETATSTTPATGLTLERYRLYEAVGETKQIIASPYPKGSKAGEITWMSTNAKIATVDENGNVTGNAVGHAKILVILDSNKTTECEVYVTSLVDLGLSVKWASTNIAAASSSARGNYYAWGELGTKSEYSKSNYIFFKETIKDEYKVTKYCSLSKYGDVDGKTRLEPEDDIATFCFGEGWHIPTEAQVRELFNNCTVVHGANVKQAPDNGMYLTSKINGNSIFLPFTGFYQDKDLAYQNKYGYYWTSETSAGGDAKKARYFDSTGGLDSYLRSFGRAIRPVKDK